MYSRVLVPIDPAHGDVVARIVAVARYLAGDDGQITLLTVLEPIPGYVATYIPKETLEANRADARARIVEAARTAGIEDARIELLEGAPSTMILEEADRFGADAIVLGSHRPDYRDYLIGSTAARVVRHAQCTVIVERSEV